MKCFNYTATYTFRFHYVNTLCIPGNIIASKKVDQTVKNTLHLFRFHVTFRKRYVSKLCTGFSDGDIVTPT